ncbi:MarR family transcriptional regulator [Streptomyces sp. NPDC051665]|uniref:MarR family winged helix-turn-helix transcriptional regulator n=1 Tax=Streptomyces sp. NPDC051665 TaxID=3154647 RepID=UPI00343E819C
MRYVDRHPGTTAHEAAEATQMISSNFSRAVRGLEQAGLVRRDTDERDARRVRLYPTEKAQENLRRLREVWSRLLAEAVTDSDDIRRRDLDPAHHRDPARRPDPPPGPDRTGDAFLPAPAFGFFARMIVEVSVVPCEVRFAGHSERDALVGCSL